MRESAPAIEVNYSSVSFDNAPQNIRTQVINELQIIIMEVIGENAASPDLTLNRFHIIGATPDQLTMLRERIDAFLKTLPVT